jgi:hypothetical protein
MLTSLEFFQNRLDVHIVAIDLPTDAIRKIETSDREYVRACVHRHTMNDFKFFGASNNIRSKKARYAVMATLVMAGGLNYDGIMFTDADLFFTGSIMPFLKMVAGTPYVIGVNENFKWNLGAYQFNREQLPSLRMDWMICNAPVFFDPKRSKDFIAKAEHAAVNTFEPRKNKSPSDLFTMNVALWLCGKVNRKEIVRLPSHQWTGVHSSYFLPTTLIKPNGAAFQYETKSNETVYSIHGKWDKESKIDETIRNATKKADELGLGDKEKKTYLKNVENSARHIAKDFEDLSRGG